MRHATQHVEQGFTLIELMITVAVLAITVALAAPSFKDLLAAQRLRSVAYDMTSDLVLARSEAVKRGQDVTIAPLDSGWKAGWTVRVPSSSEVIASRSAAGGGVVFTTSPGTVTFDLNGRLGTTSSVVRFELNGGVNRNRCISIDPSGRPKSVTTACPT